MSRPHSLRLAPAPTSAGHDTRNTVDPGGLAMRVKVLESRLRNFSAATIYSLTTLLDLRDLSTGTHGTRLADWAVRVGELVGLGVDELEDLEIACLLHDVGKVGLSDSLLNKPGRLSAEEREQMQKHPEMGWAILRLLPGFERVSLLVLHHHERVDGAGYPAGLTGDEIPVGARIVAVVDAFDAMISDRPYRAGMPVDEAMGRLEAASGTQFDAAVVELFHSMVRSDHPVEDDTTASEGATAAA